MHFSMNSIPIPELKLVGSDFERGQQMGCALSCTIHHFLGEGIARIEWIIGSSIERTSLDRMVLKYAKIIEQYIPTIAEEIHGLADGAEISIEDAYLLQMRREVIGDMASDCTTIAISGLHRCIAQTIDLPGNFADLPVVVHSKDDKRSILQITFAGLLGYVGLNDRGLAVGINMILSDGWSPGIPPYLIVRRLLELDSVAECLEELSRLPRASSRCYTLLDDRTLVQVETTCTQMAILEGNSLIHTNHYLSTELAKYDRSHIIHRRNSRHRLERVKTELESLAVVDGALGQDTEVVGLFTLLTAHGEPAICIHGNGDPRRFETVAAVVIRPAERQLLARRGPPCQASTQIYQLEETTQ